MIKAIANGILDFVRGIVRPVAVFVILGAFIAFAGGLEPEQAVDATTPFAAMALTYYFVERTHSKKD